MDHYVIKTGGALQYYFKAAHFNIIEGILYFYKDTGELVWVIKEWISFRIASDADLNDGSINPDNFYDELNKGDQ